MNRQQSASSGLAIFRRIIDAIGGQEGLFPMEQRIFNCAIFVSIATFVPAILFVSALGWWKVSLGLLVCIGVYSYVFYLGRFVNKLQRAVFVFSVIAAVLLNTMWVLDRGAGGSTAFYIFIVLQIIIFTANKPLRYVVAVIINLIVLGAVDDTLREWINFEIPVNDIGQYMTLVSAVLYMAILALLYCGLMRDKTQSSFTDIMQQLQLESQQINQVADSLVQSGDMLSVSALQQKAAIEQLLATTEELAATAEQNSQLAMESNSMLKRAEMQMADSKNNTEQLLRFIQEIRQSSQEIQNINNVINEIAWQTNLLSLNAMIEASRAGDGHGGFKVVALEVKRLAERAADAADGINQLLAANLKSVQKGVDFSADMQRAFESVINDIQPLSLAVRNMSDASVEQTQAIFQINQGLVDIDRVITQNQHAAEETAQTSNELRTNAEALLKIVQNLKEEMK